MKTDSDNFRSSPIIEIIENLKLSKDIDILYMSQILKKIFYEHKKN